MEYENAVRELGRFAAPLLKAPESVKERVYDICLSKGKPVMLCGGAGTLFLRENGTAASVVSADCPIVSQKDVDEIFRRLCGYSVYSHTEEIKNGFISSKGGLRVGIAGVGVQEAQTLRTVRDIRSLTIRIPREKRGCARPLFAMGLQPEGGVLLAGEPSSGKTTLLRDLARALGASGKRTVVLDERFELLSDGFDLGLCTEVLQGYPKREAFSHALRCLSPEYILCDELSESELPAVRSAVFSGVHLIATVHASNAAQFLKRPLCRALLETEAFRQVVFLKGRRRPSEAAAVMEAGDLLAAFPSPADPALFDLCRRGGNVSAARA